MSNAVRKHQRNQDECSGSWSMEGPWPSSPCFPLDPWAPKRVCFYKSGDPQFGALHMVINSHTYKTFGALLDSLSEKVPLPFGVRNISTPRGMHNIQTLSELEDGKSYVCSDKRKVKPMDLEEARGRPSHWRKSRPPRGHHRLLASGAESRPAKSACSPALRMPEWLTVFRNGDPNTMHTVELQTWTLRNALKCISERLHFPVQKLYTLQGQKVDSPLALALCSGVVVASGREPFKLVDYDAQDPMQVCRRPSITDSTETHQVQPHAEDDIEKSFRINEDGSMTVEMKVRLTVKEEETIHWTTTLRRFMVAKEARTGSNQGLELSAHSQDSIKECYPAKDRLNSIVQNRDTLCPRRAHTPGPSCTCNQASAESIRTLSDKVCTYTCREEVPNGESVEREKVASQIRCIKVPKSRMDKVTGTEHHRAPSTSLASSISEGFHIKDSSKEIMGTMCHVNRQEIYDDDAQFSTEGQHACDVMCQHPSSTDTVITSCNQDMESKGQSITYKSPDKGQSDTLALSNPMIPSCKDNPSSSLTGCEPPVVGMISGPFPTEMERSEFINDKAPAGQARGSEESRVRFSNSKCANPKMKKNVISPAVGMGNKRREKVPGNVDNSKQPQSLNQTSERINANYANVFKNEQMLGKAQKTKRYRDGDASNRDVSVPQNIGTFYRSIHNEQNRNGPKRVLPISPNKDKPPGPFTKTASAVLPHVYLKHAKNSQTEQTSMCEDMNCLRKANEINESVALTTFHSHCNKHEETWLVRMDPDSTNSMGDTNIVNSEELRTVVQIGNNSEEELGVRDATKYFSKESSSPHFVSDKESEILEPCNTKDQYNSTLTIPAKMTQLLPMVSECLINNIDKDSPSASDQALGANMMPVLEQLYSSMQSVSPVQHGYQPSGQERSHSFSDSLSHSASSFCPSSKFLLALLSVMALSEASTSTATGGPFTDNGSCSEALSMMKFLQRLVSIEDTAKRKTCLSDLLISTCHGLLQSWSRFLEQKGSPMGDGRPLCNSLKSLILEANGEFSRKTQSPLDSTEGLLGELGMLEEFRKEVLSLVRGDMTEFTINKELLQNSEDKSFAESREGKNASSENQTVHRDSEVSSEDDEAEALEKHGSENEQVSKKQRVPFEQVPRAEVSSGTSHDMNHKVVFMSSEPLANDFVREETPESKRMQQDSESTSKPWTVTGEGVLEEGVEVHCWSHSSCFVEIPQDVLDFVNSALYSTTLSFSHDSNGSLKIGAEGTAVKLIHKMPQSNVDMCYHHKRLPSPDTSELSDYRPETSDSGGCKSQDSAELLTESGEDDCEDVRCYRERLSEGKSSEIKKSVDPTSFSADPLKQIQNTKGQSVGDFSPPNQVNATDTAVSHFNTTSSLNTCKLAQPTGRADASEGLLIDKGRWLIKENHLIRMSPPEPASMYANADTTSVDTGREDASNDLPHSYAAGPAPAISTLSSSDLEKMAKPDQPARLTYFSVPRSSDSDLFHSDAECPTPTSWEVKTEAWRVFDVCPASERPEAQPKRRDRQNSFTSVELKMADRRVYPLAVPCDIGPADEQHGTQRHRAQQSSFNSMNLLCGPHCLIL